MSDRFCSLIILGPGNPHNVKFHLSRGGVAILIAAFLLSFLAVVWVGYSVPPNVNDLRRMKLEEENRALRVEATNATLGIKKLDEKVSELEQLSNKINELVATDDGSKGN
jgi:hypothetical protein